MTQLYTDLHLKTPPPEKYAPQLSIATTTDAEAVVQAVVANKEARTLAENQPEEVSEDGRFTAVATESESSERQNLLERLARAEEAAIQDLREYEPVRPQDAEAKNVKLYNRDLEAFKAEHPDFEEVMSQANNVEISEAKRQALMEAGPQATYELAKNPELAQQFASLPDDQAAAFLKGNQASMPESGTEGKESDYDRVLALAAEKGNLEGTSETLDRFSYPDTPQLAAVNQVMSAVLWNEVPKKQWVPVVHALLSNPETVGKLETARSVDEIVSTVLETAKSQRLGEIKQRYAGNGGSKAQPIRSKLGPTRPVGGNVRATTDPGELPYSEYRKWRDEGIKTRRRG